MEKNETPMEPGNENEVKNAENANCQCGEECKCHEEEGASCEDKNCASSNENAEAEAPAEQKPLTLEEQLAQAQDKYLRLVADFDNFRKRSARERLDLLLAAGEEVIKGLLPVLDDFERAQKVAEANSELTAQQEGTRLIYQKLQDYLKSKGLQEIETKDAEFNTDFHDAVTKFPASSPEQKNKVIDTVQKGYRLNDKIIRFAKVVVGE